MMQTLLSVMGILLCGGLLAAVLRTQRPELAMCLGLAAGAAVLILLMRELTPVLVQLKRFADAAAIPAVYPVAVLKAAGITVLTQLTADTCRDAGESALASKAELAGRVLLLALAVPLFGDLLEMVAVLVNGRGVGG